MLQLNAILNLGSDAETKSINDRQYISFRGASTEKKNGQDVVTWVSVLAGFNENLLPYLKKGQQVFVSGRMSAGIYQSQNSFGIDISVFAQTLQLCGGKRDEQATVPAVSTAGQSSQPTPAATPPFAQTVAPASTPFPPAEEETKDDLPF